MVTFKVSGGPVKVLDAISILYLLLVLVLTLRAGWRKSGMTGYARYFVVSFVEILIYTYVIARIWELKS